VLSHGSVQFDSTADAAADFYLAMLAQAGEQSIIDRTDRSGRGAVRFMGVETRGVVGGDATGAITVGGAAEMAIRLNRWATGLTIHLVICDTQGQAVAHCTTMSVAPHDAFTSDDENSCEVIWSTDELLLTPGSYTVNASIYRDSELEDRLDALTTLDVLPGTVRGRPFSQPSSYGSLALPHAWSVRALEMA
jgi:hypothetical protein